VRGGVIGGGDEALVMLTATHRFQQIRNRVESLNNIAQKSEAGLQLLDGRGGLHSGGHYGDVGARSGHVVCGAHHAHVDVVAALHLRGGDDDLNGLRIVRTCDGVVQDADGASHLASGAGLGGIEVGWVTHDDGSFCHLKRNKGGNLGLKYTTSMNSKPLRHAFNYSISK